MAYQTKSSGKSPAPEASQGSRANGVYSSRDSTYSPTPLSRGSYFGNIKESRYSRASTDYQRFNSSYRTKSPIGRMQFPDLKSLETKSQQGPVYAKNRCVRCKKMVVDLALLCDSCINEAD